MKTNMRAIAAFISIVFVWTSPIEALPIVKESVINIDGAVTDITPDIDFALGFVSFTFSNPGTHYINLFLDLEYLLQENSFTNEYGAANGTPSNGQTWEIDEPGYVFGDIYNNVYHSSLDNTNSVDSTFPDDVSFALAWNFSLTDYQNASVCFYYTEDNSFLSSYEGFYLTQTDTSSNDHMYFFSSLMINESELPLPVPEPGTIFLLGTGLMSSAYVGRKKLLKL